MLLKQPANICMNEFIVDHIWIDKLKKKVKHSYSPYKTRVQARIKLLMVYSLSKYFQNKRSLRVLLVGHHSMLRLTMANNYSFSGGLVIKMKYLEADSGK